MNIYTYALLVGSLAQAKKDFRCDTSHEDFHEYYAEVDRYDTAYECYEDGAWLNDYYAEAADQQASNVEEYGAEYEAYGQEYYDLFGYWPMGFAEKSICQEFSVASDGTTMCRALVADDTTAADIRIEAPEEDGLTWESYYWHERALVGEPPDDPYAVDEDEDEDEDLSVKLTGSALAAAATALAFYV